MKKLLFAVLLLTPAFAAAEPASLANRVNVTLNISQQDPRGKFDGYLKRFQKDQDASAGLSVGYNLMDMLELGIGVNVFGSLEVDTTIPGEGKHNYDFTYYNTGMYAKVLAPQYLLTEFAFFP